MALYVLSDTHLSLSVDKPMDVFGARWDGHADKIVSRWQSAVGGSDTVVIAGDVSWAMSLDEALPDLRLLDSLNGKKILMRGNHDYWWNTMSKLGEFKSANHLDSIDFMFNNAFNVEGFTVCGTRGWYYDKKSSPPDAEYTKIVAREAGRLRLSLDAAKRISEGREILVFMHFPPVFSDFVCDELVDVLAEYGITRCYYGHIHGVYSPSLSQVEYRGIRFIITSADYLDFTPIFVG